jgi:hypothetical protein
MALRHPSAPQPRRQTVVIDSTHDGRGRQLYLIDISGIVANPPTK